ncbi:MAG: HPr family phosphocarrier protein [Candidatus Eisenbacteria bacterium]|nr:HPr family phosphocarrier protein [Candidatus Eisenbacteria bacterium]
MPEITIKITNEKGMHARAAALFSREASLHKASVFVAREGLEVNGKSIMGVLMLAAYCGSEITIKTDGDGADDAMTALVGLIENKFGEDS